MSTSTFSRAPESESASPFDETDAVDTARRRRSRRIRAILAGGLVLGIGAAVTLAAWNDSEFATGTFTAGAFNLQGSLDGSAYADHATTGTAATLAFTVPAAALSPGDVVAAPFAVRLAAGTTNNATVTVLTPTTTGTVTNLTYQIIRTGTFGCTAATTGTDVVAAGTAMTALGTVTPFPLTAGAGAAAGTAVNLCFKVTAGAALAQSQTGTTTWQLQATSQ